MSRVNRPSSCVVPSSRARVLAGMLTGTLAGVLLAAGGAGRAAAQAAPPPAPPSPAEVARADSGRPPYTAADVRFMSGMIGHHSQAVLMAGWSPARAASPALRVLCERIAVSQRDEIAYMQRWLRDRRLPVPEADTLRGTMGDMAGMDHGAMDHGAMDHAAADHAAADRAATAASAHALMPGMLTADELARLERARGRDFDRQFLTFMIRHHQGALAMVDQLFGSTGAGQDDTVFKFASDVQADQTTEIDRMTAMLAAIPPDA